MSTLCPVTGKRGWNDCDLAIRALKRMPNPSDLSAYLCDRCAMWHIGNDYNKALARIIKELGFPEHEYYKVFKDLTKE